jgi:hypothetical protein
MLAVIPASVASTKSGSAGAFLSLFFSVGFPHIFSSYDKRCFKIYTGFSYGNRRSNRPSCCHVSCDFCFPHLHLAEIAVFFRSIFSSIFSPSHEVILDDEDARNQGVHCVSFVCVDGATLRRRAG